MLSSKTIFGAGWLVSSRLTGRLIDFATLLVLARALSPADFGLAALAASLIAIVDTALEIPLSQALTRLQTIDKKHLDTAFTLGLLRGGLLSLILFAAAWPFAIVFQDPRLTALVCALAVGPAARSLYSPAMVTFVRLISFKQAFAAEMTGKLAAAASAVALANVGAGAWAIVANSVVTPLVATVLSYLIAPYRPVLSLARFLDFRGFVGWFSSAQLMVAASWQVDRGLLGYFVSKATLGRYTMASDLSVLPTQSLIGPAMQPVMAAFSRIADDRDRLARAYLRASAVTMMIAAPAGIGIALTADLLVKVMLGPQWLESSVYLRGLALATVFSAAYQPFYSLALALNRPVVLFRLSLLEIGCKALLVSLGFFLWALPGVVAARGVVAVIMFGVVLLAARAMVGLAVLAHVAALWRVAAASVAMSGLVLALRHELAGWRLASFAELAVVAACGAATYGVALLGLGYRPSLRGSGRLMPQP